MTLESEVAQVAGWLAVFRDEALAENPRASEWLSCALDDVEDALACLKGAERCTRWPQ